VVLTSWASSWVLTYTFNFMLEWSSAGESSSLPPTSKHTNTEDFFMPIVTLIVFCRNIFHLQWNVCFNYFIHMEVGARDKGTDTGRNTSNINQLIVVKGKF